MTDVARKTSFPAQGENFVTLGPWRMLSGATWHGFQLAAEEAHAHAAEAAADQITARRAARRAAQLKLDGPRAVAPIAGYAPHG